MEAKAALLCRVNQINTNPMNPETLTIGFARRATPYKRADFFFTDIERLKDDRSRR